MLISAIEIRNRDVIATLYILFLKPDISILVYKPLLSRSFVNEYLSARITFFVSLKSGEEVNNVERQLFLFLRNSFESLCSAERFKTNFAKKLTVLIEHLEIFVL